jgi:exodeoxyribonuclease VII large subunit
MRNMPPQVISVTDFVTIINETLGFAYPQVVIEGEVSSFKINQGRWIFFDLKDEANVLSCFMTVHQLKLPIEDGMKIRVTGSPKVTKFSKFSLTVKDIQLAGEGELRRAMELLKKKLAGEGLFDPARKRKIPAYPARIGLITSGTSAAYADFIKILGARWGGLDVVLADVSVQGQQAPDAIVGALEYFNQLQSPVDVVVLIRGGGSLEDLMAFSTEPVARAVASSRTPIIVGVGHEVDTSLADYAADLRAATPTDAARLVVPDRAEVAARLSHLTSRQSDAITRTITRYHQSIERSLTRLETALRYPREKVAAYQARLERGLDRLASGARASRQQAMTLELRLADRITTLSSNRRQRVLSLERVLRGFDTQATLNRGYAIVRANDQILHVASEASPGTDLVIQLGQGHIAAEVRKTS